MRTFVRGRIQSRGRMAHGLSPSLKTPAEPCRRADSILRLQRAVGNQAVMRMLRTDAEARPVGTVQTKLAISSPGDEYEQEADRVADAIVRTSDARTKSETTFANQTRPTNIQRQPSSEDETEEIEVHAKHSEGGGARAEAASESSIQNRIDGLGGSGREMPHSVKSYFEPRFGQDFGGVRLHTDANAARLAKSINARAFTVGRDIVFGAGEYAPQTLEGKRLLAHELTHVLQQRGGRSVIRRKISFEKEAYIPVNPIDTVIHNKPVGLTTPTFNGKQLPADPKSAATKQAAQQLYNQAGQIIFEALTPKSVTYNPGTKECSFADFDIKVSANVIVTTQPSNKQWTMSVAGGEIPNCKNTGNVPVVMKGVPDSDAVAKWVAANEQEHVDDLKALHAKHFEAYYKWLLGLKGTGADSGKCQESLMNSLGSRDANTARDFIKEWSDAIDNRHKGGKHKLHNKINLKNNCSTVEIESTT